MPAARPSRSRMISNVARPLTAATRPDIWANMQMPDDADDHHPRQRQTEPGADDRVGDQVTDVEEAPDRGQHAEREAEDLLHPPSRSRSSRLVVAASAAINSSGFTER